MIPLRLAAPDPTAVRQVDVVIVGAGVAGLSAALAAAPTRRVVLLSKGALTENATVWAQGGIAAALGPHDTAAEHLADTLAAGGGLCDEAAARLLVTDGPDRVRALLGLGARFDRTGDRLALTREGGHHRDRIAHAGGDATGRELHRALAQAVLAEPGIDVLADAFALDVLLNHARDRVVGLTVATPAGVLALRARAVVLATGGLGQLFPVTTNPPMATGDGVAIALRAGAEVADLEFVQFHPTVLRTGLDRPGQRVLVTEALRGEGAVLVDAAGNRVMLGVHPQADLAPRDVVAKAMTLRMAEAPGGIADRLWLDATGLDAALLERRFPTVLAACRAAGVDPVHEPIPVAPAAHYASGGVRTDLFGQTTVAGLLAAGETACTGVHGANRLASNSLLEGLVFGARVGSGLARSLPPQLPPGPAPDAGLVAAGSRSRVVNAIGEGAGIVRTGPGLAAATARLADVAGTATTGTGDRADWTATNLLTVATALVAAASLRTETRGCHWRADAPHSSPAWAGRIVHRLDASGRPTTVFRPTTTAAA